EFPLAQALPPSLLILLQHGAEPASGKALCVLRCNGVGVLSREAPASRRELLVEPDRLDAHPALSLLEVLGPQRNPLRPAPASCDQVAHPCNPTLLIGHEVGQGSSNTNVESAESLVGTLR